MSYKVVLRAIAEDGKWLDTQKEIYISDQNVGCQTGTINDINEKFTDGKDCNNLINYVSCDDECSAYARLVSELIMCNGKVYTVLEAKDIILANLNRCCGPEPQEQLPSPIVLCSGIEAPDGYINIYGHEYLICDCLNLGTCPDGYSCVCSPVVGVCVCIPNCPPGTEWDWDQGECVSICVGQYWNPYTNTCEPECGDGYIVVNGYCYMLCNCPAGNCPEGFQCAMVPTQFVQGEEVCVCIPICPPGSVYSFYTHSCVSICGDNNILVNGHCYPICNCTTNSCTTQGTSCTQVPPQYLPDGFTELCVCVPTCGENSHWDFDVHECVCNEGYIEINGECYEICPCGGTGCNEVGTDCVQVPPQWLPDGTTELCVCVPTCGENSHWDFDVHGCVCNEGYEEINGVCYPVCPCGGTGCNEVGTDCVQVPPQWIPDGMSSLCVCVPNCPDGSHWDFDVHECVCDEGYEEINGVCYPVCPCGGTGCNDVGTNCVQVPPQWLPDGMTELCVCVPCDFNPSGYSCLPSYQWNFETHTCECPDGTTVINNQCYYLCDCGLLDTCLSGCECVNVNGTCICVPICGDGLCWSFTDLACVPCPVDPCDSDPLVSIICNNNDATGRACFTVVGQVVSLQLVNITLSPSSVVPVGYNPNFYLSQSNRCINWDIVPLLNTSGNWSIVIDVIVTTDLCPSGLSTTVTINCPYTGLEACNPDSVAFNWVFTPGIPGVGNGDMKPAITFSSDINYMGQEGNIAKHCFIYAIDGQTTGHWEVSNDGNNWTNIGSGTPDGATGNKIMLCHGDMPILYNPFGWVIRWVDDDGRIVLANSHFLQGINMLQTPNSWVTELVSSSPLAETTTGGTPGQWCLHIISGNYVYTNPLQITQINSQGLGALQINWTYQSPTVACAEILGCGLWTGKAILVCNGQEDEFIIPPFEIPMDACCDPTTQDCGGSTGGPCDIQTVTIELVTYPYIDMANGFTVMPDISTCDFMDIISIYNDLCWSFSDNAGVNDLVDDSTSVANTYIDISYTEGGCVNWGQAAGCSPTKGCNVLTATLCVTKCTMANGFIQINGSNNNLDLVLSNDSIVVSSIVWAPAPNIISGQGTQSVTVNDPDIQYTATVQTDCGPFVATFLNACSGFNFDIINNGSNISINNITNTSGYTFVFEIIDSLGNVLGTIGNEASATINLGTATLPYVLFGGGDIYFRLISLNNAAYNGSVCHSESITPINCSTPQNTISYQGVAGQITIIPVTVNGNIDLWLDFMQFNVPDILTISYNGQIVSVFNQEGLGNFPIMGSINYVSGVNTAYITIYGNPSTNTNWTLFTIKCCAQLSCEYFNSIASNIIPNVVSGIPTIPGDVGISNNGCSISVQNAPIFNAQTDCTAIYDDNIWSMIYSYGNQIFDCSPQQVITLDKTCAELHLVDTLSASYASNMLTITFVNNIDALLFMDRINDLNTFAGQGDLYANLYLHSITTPNPNDVCAGDGTTTALMFLAPAGTDIMTYHNIQIVGNQITISYPANPYNNNCANCEYIFYYSHEFLITNANQFVSFVNNSNNIRLGDALLRLAAIVKGYVEVTGDIFDFGMDVNTLFQCNGEIYDPAKNYKWRIKFADPIDADSWTLCKINNPSDPQINWTFTFISNGPTGNNFC